MLLHRNNDLRWPLKCTHGHSSTLYWTSQTQRDCKSIVKRTRCLKITKLQLGLAEIISRLKMFKVAASSMVYIIYGIYYLRSIFFSKNHKEPGQTTKWNQHIRINHWQAHSDFSFSVRINTSSETDDICGVCVSPVHACVKELSSMFHQPLKLQCEKVLCHCHYNLSSKHLMISSQQLKSKF